MQEVQEELGDCARLVTLACEGDRAGLVIVIFNRVSKDAATEARNEYR
jgi:hypothetical protein